MKQIYLDNQATTMVDPEVFSAMEPWLKYQFGNAASRNHIFGWAAEEAVEIARELTAEIIGAYPNEIIFTSGATEANNLAIQGAALNASSNKKHIITLKTEHKAVLDICDYLEKNGFSITRLPVNKEGMIDLTLIEKSIKKETLLVSVMHVNNEIGVIQPIKDIGKLCETKGILFHVDAAQSVGKLPINVESFDIDLLSISAHKFYGPKGVGALYVRRKNPRVSLSPLLYGGGHERGLRSGTLPVHQIVGMGKACQIAAQVMEEETIRISSLRDQLLQGIEEDVSHCNVNGSMKHRLAGNLNMSFPGTQNEAVIAAVPEIAISSGAACTTSTMEPSHVLLALGLSKEMAYSSLRFGIGRFNTKQDIDTAVEVISRCMKKLQFRS